MQINWTITFAVIAACFASVAQGRWYPTLPDVEKPYNELYLRIDETIRTLPGNVPSAHYFYLDSHLIKPQDSNVRLLGIKTGGQEVTITLEDSTGAANPLTIVLKNGSCKASLDSASHTSDCELNFDANHFRWFLLETTVNYLALFQAGAHQVVVDLSTQDGLKADYNVYDRYSLSSAAEAVWDVQGHNLPKDYVPEDNSPFVSLPLPWIQENLLEMKKQQWRCEEAISKKDIGSSIMYMGDYEYFNSIYCSDAFDKYRASIVRHESLVRALGGAQPKREEYDVNEFFNTNTF